MDAKVCIFKKMDKFLLLNCLNSNNHKQRGVYQILNPQKTNPIFLLVL